MIGFALSQDGHLETESRNASTSGALRYGHFDVVVGADGLPVELGSGAMAVTYRAHDTVLACDVALKVIDQRVAEHPVARARFLREARAAAQIHHPNVAGVSHYGEQDGECYYVMELVQGETLEAKVRRDGPLSPAQVLEVGIQAARALVAAEACGVVHRDLKPSNLMIVAGQGDSDETDSFAIKVIDFGLAKGFTAESSLGLEQTRSGFVGTPAFASPEQFAPADDARIDTRSDIYSLGVTLWYLLAGQPPFTGRTLEEIHARQLETSSSDQLAAAHVPKRMLGVLNSMLQADPAARPQSARALLDALRACREHGRLGTRRTLIAGTAIAVTALVALAAGGAWWYYGRLHPGPASDKSLAVLPFENLSPDKTEAFFAIGVQDEITADLARISALKVIGSASTRSYLPNKRDIAAISSELGAQHLLEGSVWRANGQMRVSLRLVNAQDIGHPWTATYDRPIQDIFALKSEITRAVAARLQIRLSPRETAALDLPPTTDLQAYDFYLRAAAIPKLVKDTAEQRRRTEQCIPLLNEAVARDPKFVLAYCKLAKTHAELHRTRQGARADDVTVDHRALAEGALEQARRLQPDAGPVHHALAEHYYSVDRNMEQARIEADLALRTMPNSAELEGTAGSIARAQSRWNDAVRHFEKAVALEPRENVSRFTLANTQRLLRDYDDFDHLMAEVIAVLPAKDSATYRLFRAVGSLERDADLAPLRATLTAIRAEEDPDGSARDLHGVILGLADHDADTILLILARAAESSFVFNGVAHPKGWYEGLAARIRGDAAGAQTAFNEARVKVEKAVLADATDGRTLSLLAMIDAGLGRREEAVQEARRACDLEPFENSGINAPVVRCNLAVVYAWIGQPERATAELEKLVTRPAGGNIPAQPTYGDFRLNPVWDPLRNDPRFARLVARLEPHEPEQNRSLRELPDKSVAVLPFENLSPDKADAFFTVGMQEEISADLARIGALKVIGSESTRSYPPTNRNLAKIGAELGVRHLLEGSVRREDGQVHVALRLINVRDPAHSWIQQYDRPLTEVFAMQGEIIRATVDHLHAEFSKGEKAAIDEPPTGDLAAYDLYLRAREGPSLWDNDAAVRRDSERKIALLNEAVTRDPSFTLAYCELAKAHGRICFYKAGATVEELSVDHRSLAEVALQKARRLRPDAGELHLAQAFYFLYVTKDLEQAHIETDLARVTLPNSAEVESIAARVARRQGRWDDAVRDLARAAALDPRTKNHPYTLAETYRLLRRYEDFDRTMAQMIDMSPGAKPGSFTAERALGELEGRAEMGPLRKAVDAASAANNFSDEDRDLTELLFSLWNRDSGALLRKLSQIQSDEVEITGVQHPKTWFEALAARIRGDASKAEAAFAAARIPVANAVIADATSGRKLGLLAMIDAGLGRRDQAVKEARRACELSAKVATDAPIAACNLAVVYAWTGQSDLALAVLEEWIIRPAGINEPSQPTYGDFRLNPVWDPLRNDPRFVKLVDRLAPPKAR